MANCMYHSTLAAGSDRSRPLSELTGEGGGGSGFVLLALSAFLPSLISLVYPTKGGGGGASLDPPLALSVS